MICSIVPVATTFPPCSPAPGPMSIMWSADLIMASSCSTTITVLPISLRSDKVVISMWSSCGCNPIVGSSHTYRTPVNPEPICVANRTRWASPPDKVLAVRSMVRYPRPMLSRNLRRPSISFNICAPIVRSRSVSVASVVSWLIIGSISDIHFRPSLMLMLATSMMLIPQTCTANASGRRRLPWQVWQGLADMYLSISCLT